MNFLLQAIRDEFCSSALSFNKIDYRKRFFLSLIILFNVVYIFFNGGVYLSKFLDCGLRVANILFSIVSVTLFLFALKGNLYNTFKFQKGKLFRSIIYADITYITSFILYSLYNYIMTLYQTPLGGDVQKIKEIAKMDWLSYFTLVGRYVVSLLNEELLILAVFLIFLSMFNSNKVKNTLIAIFLTLVFFGFLHLAAWNWATIPAVMVSKFSAVILFIFWKDLKPLYLAHLFNNSYVALTTVQGMTGQFRNDVFFIFLLPLAGFACYCMLHYCLIYKKENLALNSATHD